MNIVKPHREGQPQQLRSLFDEPGADRYMSHDDKKELFDRIIALSKGGGDTTVRIDSRWTGNLRWARNYITTSGETTDHTVEISRVINGATGDAGTNKFDDESLKIALETAERRILYRREDWDASLPPGAQQYLQPQLWDQPTYDLGPEARSQAARKLVQPALDAQLLSAGYAEVRAYTRSVLNTQGMDAYYKATRAEYSVTVRNPGGTASGWAGRDGISWQALDPGAISAKALQKCVDSADPKAVEPGRWTVILEPQAVHDLMVPAIYALDRYTAELLPTVYTLHPGQTKIGLKVFDEKITISTDPMDPECGYIPFDRDGWPYKPTTWVENGVLKEMAYNKSYALTRLNRAVPQPNPNAYRIHDGISTLEEMIASTRRGLLVTRLSNMSPLDGSSLLMTGTSRDGLWLIENGKVTYSAKNMRFTESPMFAFNNVELIGKATRVYATYPAVVPPMKVLDFNFTSLADAV